MAFYFIFRLWEPGLRQGATIGYAVSDRSRLGIRERGGIRLRDDLSGETEGGVGTDEGRGGGVAKSGGEKKIKSKCNSLYSVEGNLDMLW